MAEKRPWSEEEDEILKHVFETSGLTKWSHIARKMQAEHGITGRSGKQCRER
jgi:AraC-like DNA-binding protein